MNGLQLTSWHKNVISVVLNKKTTGQKEMGINNIAGFLHWEISVSRKHKY